MDFRLLEHKTGDNFWPQLRCFTLKIQLFKFLLLNRHKKSNIIVEKLSSNLLEKLVPNYFFIDFFYRSTVIGGFRLHDTQSAPPKRVHTNF